jgi:hypothetical protein
MLNRNLYLQRFKVLFVTGDYSGIRAGFIGSSRAEIRRGLATFQLMTIFEEVCRRLIIVEHDPSLYVDSTDMVECIQQALNRQLMSPPYMEFKEPCPA